MKRKCVLGVLKTEEGLRIKEEMLGWLNEKYDVTLVEVDPPNDIEFEYPFIKKACEVAIESNEPVLYLHTKGAANQNHTQVLVRKMWQIEFGTDNLGLYFEKVNKEAPTVSCVIGAVENKVCWYNGYVMNVAAAKLIYSKLRVDTRYWYEGGEGNGLLFESNVNVSPYFTVESANEAYLCTLEYFRNKQKKYTILVYNFGHYEIMREPKEIDPECDYIYVTDDEKYAQQTKIWTVIVDKSLEGLSTFDKCYAVRFNLFKYAKTPVCIYLDGSIQINKSFRKLYEDFMLSNADVGVNIHPVRNRIDVEYLEWIRTREYSLLQADKCLNAAKQMGYDVDELGLCQGTCRICKNTAINTAIDQNTLQLLKQLGNGTIERLDQTIYTIVLTLLNKQKPIRVFPFSQQVLQSDIATWCFHGTPNPIPWNKGNDKNDAYLFNNLTHLYKI